MWPTRQCVQGGNYALFTFTEIRVIITKKHLGTKCKTQYTNIHQKVENKFTVDYLININEKLLKSEEELE